MTLSKILSASQRAWSRGTIAMVLAAGRATLASIQRLLGQRYVSRRIHNYRMILDLRDFGLSRALILFRARELDHKVMLERIVQPGMRIFDIGGNIGYYPLMELNLLSGTGELIVVEPVPSNVALLRRNLKLNGHSGITVIEAAVSNSAGKKSFHLAAQSNLGTFHAAGAAANTLTGNTLDVETITIPMLAERHGPPDLIRMDIEGHEVEAIGGMLDDVARGAYAPSIIFETHRGQYSSEHDMTKILRRLFELRYKVALMSATDKASEQLVRLGYSSGPRLATDAVYRTLFSDIRPDDAIEFICHAGGVRTVVLEKNSQGNS
jgi:FkbM family methyltransferase